MCCNSSKVGNVSLHIFVHTIRASFAADVPVFLLEEHYVCLSFSFFFCVVCGHRVQSYFSNSANVLCSASSSPLPWSSWTIGWAVVCTDVCVYTLYTRSVVRVALKISYHFCGWSGCRYWLSLLFELLLFSRFESKEMDNHTRIDCMPIRCVYVCSFHGLFSLSLSLTSPSSSSSAQVHSLILVTRLTAMRFCERCLSIDSIAVSISYKFSRKRKKIDHITW